MNNGIAIKDYDVLLNLHKALLEAKFHLNPDNAYVAGSPIIADLYNEILDVLGKMDEEKDEKNTGKWEEWRQLKNQSFYRDRAFENAIKEPFLKSRWMNMENEGKMNVARNYLSPFIATEKELKEFVDDIDEVLL